MGINIASTTVIVDCHRLMDSPSTFSTCTCLLMGDQAILPLEEKYYYNEASL